MNATQMLASAFSVSATQHNESQDLWVRISFRVQAGLTRAAPKLTQAIQKLGQLDVLLRTLEDESTLDATHFTRPILADNYQILLTEAWICLGSDILTRLKRTHKAAANPTFKDLAHGFRLVRVPIAKFEIAADAKLKNRLVLERHSVGAEKRDSFEYDQSDPNRTYQEICLINENGSVAWLVLDVSAKSNVYVVRRQLSDKFIELFNN
ncbi:MAG: hypothetical protein AAFY56_22190 [Pseudomonadota bacterium]